MNVLGPYQFTTADADTDCGCGADYCALIQNQDKIVFQIPASELCCGESLSGCAELTESCINEEEITVELDGEVGPSGVCWDTQDFVADDPLIFAEADFEASTTYTICFCISGNVTNMGFAAFIGSEESITVTGNGNFCLRVTTNVFAGVFEWGIMVKGGDDTVLLCMSCLSVCEAATYEADLVDENDAVISALTAESLDNGNVSYALTVLTAEINPGCYRVKLTNDCNADVLYSQCIKVAAVHACTVLFKWRDTKNVFGFDYLTDTDYYNYLRVKGRLKHPTYPDESDIFRLSNNSNVLTNAVVQRIYQCVMSTPGVPDFVHDAMAVMRRHQVFLIDGVSYVVAEGEYQPVWRKSSDLATCVIEVLSQDFDGVNSYCS